MTNMYVCVIFLSNKNGVLKNPFTLISTDFQKNYNFLGHYYICSIKYFILMIKIMNSSDEHFNTFTHPQQKYQ